MSRLLAAALALLLPATVAAAPPSVAGFFANPRFAGPSLSPSGRRAAVLAAQGDTQILLVREVGEPGWAPVTRLDPTLRFTGAEWESERMLLIGAELRSPDSVECAGGRRVCSRSTPRTRRCSSATGLPTAVVYQAVEYLEFPHEVPGFLRGEPAALVRGSRRLLRAQPRAARRPRIRAVRSRGHGRPAHHSMTIALTLGRPVAAIVHVRPASSDA